MLQTKTTGASAIRGGDRMKIILMTIAPICSTQGMDRIQRSLFRADEDDLL